jgi:exodeoxyribonuclease-3
MPFKVATFNTNSVRARLPILLAWLDKERPDVLALQETKTPDDQFPAVPFHALGYDVGFRGEKAYNGVALLAREPLLDLRFGLDDGGPADETRLVSATVRGVSIVNTYVPQGRATDDPMFPYKLDWFGRLRRYFDRRFSPRGLVLWMGDFNVAPEPIDVHDPKRLLGEIGFHPDEHAALAKVKAWGFEDVLRRHAAGPGEYTFWDYRVKDGVARGKGWRVDHIWATAPLAKRSTRAWIDLAPRLAERPSDHTPVVAEFAL